MKITGITSSEYSPELILPGGKKKKSSFSLGFADKKDSSVCFFYSEANLSLSSLTGIKAQYLEKASRSQAPIKGRLPGESEEHCSAV